MRPDLLCGRVLAMLSTAADMSSRINDREDVEDLQAWLDGNHLMDDVPDGDDSAPEQPVDPCWRSKMVIQILLHTGQASPTHTFVFLDRYVTQRNSLDRNELNVKLTAERGSPLITVATLVSTDAPSVVGIGNTC